MFESLHPRRFRRERPEAAAIGLLFVFLAGVHLWTLLVGSGYAWLRALLAAAPAYPVLAGSVLTNVVGYALPAVAYVSLRGLDVSPSAPEAVDRRTLLLVASPAVAVAAVSLVAVFVFDSSLAALAQRYHSPAVRPWFVVRTSLLPAVFAAVGTGLLYFGVVQTRLRELTTDETAVVLTPVVVAVFHHLPMAALSFGRIDGPTVALFALSVAVSVCVGLTLGLVYRGVAAADPGVAVDAGDAPVLLVGTFGVLTVVLALLEFPGAVTDLLVLVAVAVAAVAYDRAESLGVPVATLFVYHAAVGVVIFLEVAAGVAPAV